MENPVETKNILNKVHPLKSFVYARFESSCLKLNDTEASNNRIRIDEARQLKEEGYGETLLKYTEYSSSRIRRTSPKNRNSSSTMFCNTASKTCGPTSSGKTSSSSGTTRVRTGLNGILKSGVPEPCAHDLNR